MYYRRRWAQTLDQTAKMSQRLDNTKWLWCMLALHAGSLWGAARSVNVRKPPSNPSTIEAQAKFFQDFFSVQLSPYKIEFGHVCEDPNTWEQRYEKKDFKNHRDMGKVRWGDKKGGYGEHYWDLNHAGNAANQGDDSYDGDDGSYHESSNTEPFDEPRDNTPTYGSYEYDPEKSSYEESGRAKRAYPKVKHERKRSKSPERQYDENSGSKKQNRKNKERLEAAETSQEEEYEESDEENDEENESTERPTPKRKQQTRQKQTDRNSNRKQEEDQQPKEKNQFVLVVSHKDDSDKQSQYLPTKQPELAQYVPQQQHEFSHYSPQKQPELQHYVPNQQLEPPKYVPYEGGAGVRQHQQPDASVASTVPRLFLEPSTGHVVDRATGQAYVLQPIAAHNNYN